MKQNSESNFYQTEINRLIEELKNLKQVVSGKNNKSEVNVTLLKVRKMIDRLISLNESKLS